MRLRSGELTDLLAGFQWSLRGGRGGKRKGRGREGKEKGGEVDFEALAQLEQGRRLAKAAPKIHQCPCSSG